MRKMERPRLEQGLVQIYSGMAKGKTTASLGLAFRAIGHGFRVSFIQLVRAKIYSGILESAARLYPNMEVMQFGRTCPYAALLREGMRKCTGCRECFVKKGEATKEDREIAVLGWKKAQQIVASDEYDIVILDDISNAIAYGLITTEQVVELIKSRPPQVELILTGSYLFPQDLLDLANLITEMKEIKHPYYQGIKPRRGIEY